MFYFIVFLVLKVNTTFGYIQREKYVLLASIMNSLWQKLITLDIWRKGKTNQKSHCSCNILLGYVRHRNIMFNMTKSATVSLLAYTVQNS